MSPETRVKHNEKAQILVELDYSSQNQWTEYEGEPEHKTRYDLKSLWSIHFVTRPDYISYGSHMDTATWLG